MLSRLSRRNFSNICKTGLDSKFCVILGSQWGDEGKGKLVDILAKDYDVCARFNGGSNAGHTIVVDKVKYAFHLLPCGILYPKCTNILGNGVVVHAQTMFEELEQLDKNGVDYHGRLKISDRATLVSNIHREADRVAELRRGDGKIGTTLQGIGPSYASKILRFGLRVGDLLDWDLFTQKYEKFVESAKYQFHVDEFDSREELDQLRVLHEKMTKKDDMIVDSIEFMSKTMNDSSKRIIAEGANACMLDVDYGTYPFVTSSSTTIGGVCTGLGVPPQAIQTTIGIMKAYTTRVGSGPFPSELLNETGETLQKVGHEFGATTGRPRRCGWLDLNVVKYSQKINGYTSINMTKLDVLSGLKELEVVTHYDLNGQKLDGQMPATIEDLAKCKVVTTKMSGWEEDISKCTKMSELPTAAQDYIKFIEKEMGTPITWVGTGPEREAMFLNA